MRILWYSDSPTVNTGFGVVARNLITRLLEQREDLEIDVIGVNEDGEHHELRRHPRLRIFPASSGQDFHGRMKLLKTIADGATEYDHVFLLHDLYTLLQPLDSDGESVVTGISQIKQSVNIKFHWYFPVDVQFPDDADLRWLKPLKYIDTLIPYTYFAKEQVEKAELKTVDPIYHGVDTDTFYPLNRAQRKRSKEELFGIDPKRNVISVIARNQWRKNIPFSIETFKQYKKHYDENAFLYIHSRVADVGGDLRPYLNMWGLKSGQDYLTAGMLDTQRGVDNKTLNRIYGATDLLLSSACGEGFGLPYLEAMATKTAVLAPDVSVESEILPLDYRHKSAIPMYVSSGQDAFPYPRFYPWDSYHVAEEIDGVISMSEWNKEVKKEAYQSVIDNFRWNQAAKRISEILS